jgi:hypothetical protein
MYPPTHYFGRFPLFTPQIVSDFHEHRDKNILSVGTGPAPLERMLVRLGINRDQIVLADKDLEAVPSPFAVKTFDIYAEWPHDVGTYDLIVFPESLLVDAVRGREENIERLYFVVSQALLHLKPGGAIRIKSKLTRNEVLPVIMRFTDERPGVSITYETDYNSVPLMVVKNEEGTSSDIKVHGPGTVFKQKMADFLDDQGFMEERSNQEWPAARPVSQQAFYTRAVRKNDPGPSRSPIAFPTVSNSMLTGGPKVAAYGGWAGCELTNSTIKNEFRFYISLAEGEYTDENARRIFALLEEKMEHGGAAGKFSFMMYPTEAGDARFDHIIVGFDAADMDIVQKDLLDVLAVVGDDALSETGPYFTKPVRKGLSLGQGTETSNAGFLSVRVRIIFEAWQEIISLEEGRRPLSLDEKMDVIAHHFKLAGIDIDDPAFMKGGPELIRALVPTEAAMPLAEIQAKAEEEGNRPTTISYEGFYRDKYMGLPTERLKALARTLDGDELAAICHDQTPGVIIEALNNPNMAVRHALIIAQYHNSAEGLSALANKPRFFGENSVKEALLRNSVTPPGVVDRIFNSYSLQDLYNEVAKGHNFTFAVQRAARKKLRQRFERVSVTNPAEAAQFIVNTGGRGLEYLIGVVFSRGLIKELLKRSYESPNLIWNLAKFQGLPPELAGHLLKQRAVKVKGKGNSHIRKKLEQKAGSARRP